MKFATQTSPLLNLIGMYIYDMQRRGRKLIISLSPVIGKLRGRGRLILLRLVRGHAQVHVSLQAQGVAEGL